jgi:hypothetical protein
MSNWQGKGSNKRPYNSEVFNKEYDRIFNKKKSKDDTKEKSSRQTKKAKRKIS